MRDIQEIFNLIITEGLFDDKYGDGDVYMCDSVDSAFHQDIITAEEREYVKNNISKYIRGTFSLRGTLKRNGHPHEYEHRKALYLDWANRPELTHMPDGYYDFEN